MAAGLTIVTTIIGRLLFVPLPLKLETLRPLVFIAVISCSIPLAGLTVAVMRSLKESPLRWWEYVTAAVLAVAIGFCVATVVIAGG